MSLYSIGHSNHSSEALLALLQLHQIAVLVDARSVPYSRYNAHFRREPLQQAMRAAGIEYCWLGERLGGKVTDPALLRDNGQVDYAKLTSLANYQAGITRLIELGAAQPTAFLCAEANFKQCHRYWLLTRTLWEQGIPVQHILANGTLAQTEPNDFCHSQPSLF